MQAFFRPNEYSIVCPEDTISLDVLYTSQIQQIGTGIKHCSQSAQNSTTFI